MAFIPHIPEIEDFTDLLDILGSKTKFGERLQAINDAQTLLNKSLDRFKHVTDIEKERQKAAGLVADARQVKTDADAYAAAKQKEGDEYYAGKMADIQNSFARLEERERSFEAVQANVNAQAAALDAQEREVAQREQDAKLAKAQAEQMQREAQLMQEKYLSKLDAMRAVAAD